MYITLSMGVYGLSLAGVKLSNITAVMSEQKGDSISCDCGHAPESLLQLANN